MRWLKKLTPLLVSLSIALFSPAWKPTDAAAFDSGSETSAIAATSDDPDALNEAQINDAADIEPELFLPGIRLFDATHHYFSQNIEKLSDRIDSVFGSDRIFEEVSGTYLQVRGSLVYGKGGEITFDGRIRAKLRLDNLNDRLHILVSGEEDPVLPDTVISGGRLSDTYNDLDPAASLQLILLERDLWDIRLQPGLKFRAPIDPFFKVRLRRQQVFAKRWLWRTTLSPVWYNSRGYEFPVVIDLERDTGRGHLFRSSSRVVWREEASSNLFVQEALLFSHSIGRRNLLAYVAGVDFEREPKWQDTEYFFNIRLRRNIHRGWVFFEISPQLLFVRSNDFKPEPSLAITLELMFGGAYLQ